MEPIELFSRREALGMSQDDLAQILGVKQVSVSHWQNGKRGIPPGIELELAKLESTVQGIADGWLDFIDDAEKVGLASVNMPTYASDAALWRAIPELGDVPSRLHRVATARAKAGYAGPVEVNIVQG